MRSASPAHPPQLFSLPDVLMLLVALGWGMSYGVSKQALVCYPAAAVLHAIGGELIVGASMWAVSRRRARR